jgi:small-conductance mechanosensitive channel
LSEILGSWWSDPAGHAALTLAIAAVLALVVDRLVLGVARRVATRTRWTGDDIVLGAIQRPLAWSVLLAGVWLAQRGVALPDDVRSVLMAVLSTLFVVFWTVGVVRIGHAGLGHLSREHQRYDIVQPRTLPLFDMGFKTFVLGGSIYLVLLAWGIDVTAWLASAGVIGIAVGFAAKDTLANLFAGLFILADAPYRLGDFVVLDDGTRGLVTEIGLRSTRLLTRDDIAVIVPNSLMSAGRIINESAGPAAQERVRCPLSVAYGTDLDKVRSVLEDVVAGLDIFVREAPRTPRVRFRRFGDSGVELEVLAWIRDPAQRGPAIDQLIVAIHKRFAAEQIEIPYPKRDVYLHPRA